MILHCLIRGQSRRLKSDAFSLIRYYSWGMRAVEEEAAACEATVKRVHEMAKLKRFTGSLPGDDPTSHILPLRLRVAQCLSGGARSPVGMSRRPSPVHNPHELVGAGPPLECGISERRCTTSLLEAPTGPPKNVSLPQRVISSSSVAGESAGIFIRRNASGQPIAPSSAYASNVGKTARAPARDRGPPQPLRFSPRRLLLGSQMSLDGSGSPTSGQVQGTSLSESMRTEMRPRIYEPRTEEAPCFTPVCSRPRYPGADPPGGRSLLNGHSCDQETLEPRGSPRRRPVLRPGHSEGGEFSTGASPAASSSSFNSHTWRVNSFTDYSSFVEYCGGDAVVSGPLIGAGEYDRGPAAVEEQADSDRERDSRGLDRDGKISSHRYPDGEADGLELSDPGRGTATLPSQGYFDRAIHARQASPFVSTTARQVASHLVKPSNESDCLPNGLPRPRPLEPHAPPGSPGCETQGSPKARGDFRLTSLRLPPPQSPCPPVTITYKSEKQSIWEEPRPEKEKIRARVHVVGRKWPPPMPAQFFPT
ncbi:conserved hypothetical protein [Neospora caninum Liverpool]|uniref:Uncharacterized protein n=1 Tax=Neospora caninum (strain Liverpool) TaxID=572307 RepID=F0VGA7_NEOCL|nr:conserved hypothetical protein [Neospora caninum Liverpool]CBZ52751.1 conserved hypothetical protein [Neospora caninum Liverpool]CEL66732.1 TPA: hypothetical protein BN1204_025390 [Neospora caninum Liverpool]|eukprot:XP_003882783.1 conserved hypothetical protein [Neospora caninum Liverpool]